MRKLGSKTLPSAGTHAPLTRQSLELLAAIGKKQALKLHSIKSAALLLSATLIVFAALTFVVIDFYLGPVSVSKRGWVDLRTLTPAVDVKAPVDGRWDQSFVRSGQSVRKGTLLGAIDAGSLQLDYQDAQRDFAHKIVELHCLTSFRQRKSSFKLPYEAQLLVDQMANGMDLADKIKACEAELLRNLLANQALEERIFALEDYTRLLEKAVKIRGDIITLPQEAPDLPPSLDQITLIEAYRDQYFPLIRLAEAEQKLKDARADYFTVQLQKEENLDNAIEQTIQDIRYLNKRLHELDQKLEDIFVYATISGTVIGPHIPKPGTHLQRNDVILKIEPAKNDIVLSIPLEENDIPHFKPGTHVKVHLKDIENPQAVFDATTVSVLRQSSGALEAVMDVSDGAKTAISEVGRIGTERFQAYITTGEESAWAAIRNIIY